MDCEANSADLTFVQINLQDSQYHITYISGFALSKSAATSSSRPTV